MDRDTVPPSSEHAPDSNPTAVPPVLYRALLDTLDQPDRAHVIDAISRHDEEVRAADVNGLRPTEAQ